MLMNVPIIECADSQTRNVKTDLEVTDVFAKMVSNERIKDAKVRILFIEHL